MKTIINDIQDLQDHIIVDDYLKEILLIFDRVEFNCAIPNKNHFSYFQEHDIKDFSIIIKASKITFNYHTECDEIYTMNLITRDLLKCKKLIVAGETKGDSISANLFVGSDITVNRLFVNKISCKKINTALLRINKKDYCYILAGSIDNIGGDND